MLGIEHYSAFREKEDYIILLPNHVYGEYDCAGLLMDLEDLLVSYQLDENGFGPDDSVTTLYLLEDILLSWLWIIETEKVQGCCSWDREV
ncbi:hypothetical protein BDW74DRAFT_157043 [Aspergillus multicolor]|uniref:uncharacterized protein n=1 Tax=Aspergillus multicolor TaxID=41759 RepID=UPI003CCD3043